MVGLGERSIEVGIAREKPYPSNDNRMEVDWLRAQLRVDARWDTRVIIHKAMRVFLVMPAYFPYALLLEPLSNIWHLSSFCSVMAAQLTDHQQRRGDLRVRGKSTPYWLCTPSKHGHPDSVHYQKQRRKQRRLRSRIIILRYQDSPIILYKTKIHTRVDILPV